MEPPLLCAALGDGAALPPPGACLPPPGCWPPPWCRCCVQLRGRSVPRYWEEDVVPSRPMPCPGSGVLVSAREHVGSGGGPRLCEYHLLGAPGLLPFTLAQHPHRLGSFRASSPGRGLPSVSLVTPWFFMGRGARGVEVLAGTGWERMGDRVGDGTVASGDG